MQERVSMMKEVMMDRSQWTEEETDKEDIPGIEVYLGNSPGIGHKIDPMTGTGKGADPQTEGEKEVDPNTKDTKKTLKKTYHHVCSSIDFIYWYLPYNISESKIK